MAAAFAEMERNLTSERTKAALSHLKAGRQAYTHITPLGFTRDGHRLVENKVEIAVVKLIQKQRAAGYSLAKIAAHLNNKSVPTKLSGKWHLVTVQSVLRVHRI